VSPPPGRGLPVIRRARRRPVSLTSLIDVIFLLLLFVMLSSPFAKFAEVDMAVGQSGRPSVQPDQLVFVQLEETRLTLNGTPTPMTDLAAQIGELGSNNVVVSVRKSASAQRMTDLLVALRVTPDLRVTLLGDE